ncbi:MAG: 2-methylcitrate dehydratase PrpD [Alphaproteobacteria bacterium]|jgi:2-methylcitrate dehydratase PrpD
MTTCSERLADFITGFDLADVPEPLIGIAETGFIDTIGVMLAGAQEPAAKLVAEMVAAQGDQPAASVVGQRIRTAPENAALINGTATQALDYDLSFMIGQSTAALTPGLLPLAETSGTTPRELIAAYIVGTEVCGTLARCFPTLSSDGGWHGAGVLGTIAATAAMAKLIHLPPGAIVNAIGIAASMPSGISINFGTMTKPLHSGLAARNAMMAVRLGEKGFTASADALEGKSGFFTSYGRGLDWTITPFDDLGKSFTLIDPGYKIKPFACGGLLHCTIEAALAIGENFQPSADNIERIVLGVGPHAKNRAIDRYPWSEDSARFSLRYLVAYALIHGAPMVSAFTAEGYDDDSVRALATLCETELDDEFATITGSGYSPGRVTIILKDGKRFEKAVTVPTGTRDTPMGAERIKAKFLSCASPVLGPDAASHLYNDLKELGARATLKDLWPQLSAG